MDAECPPVSYGLNYAEAVSQSGLATESSATDYICMQKISIRLRTEQ